MKSIISIFLVVSLVTVACADQESAIDIAKRVIADKSSPYTPLDLAPPGYVPAPLPRNPEDVKLETAARQSQDIVAAYWLSDAIPEKIRIAYAISVLASKRAVWSPNDKRQIIVGKLDKDMVDGHNMGTDKLLLTQQKNRPSSAHETFSLVGSLERFVGETGDLPLRFPGGGSAVCVW